MTTLPCRWGILSTANIGRKNWNAIHASGNGIVRGVSSRSLERSQTFIDDCQAEAAFDSAPQAFGGHQSLIDCDEIDAVYIPMPTGLRKEWVVAAAEAGKHVLIEKPIAPSAADAQVMRDACDRAGVQFMDGVMFDHGKRIQEVARQIQSGSLGKVRRIQAHFSFVGDDEFQAGNIRTDSQLEPHGCLGDLGWYCIRFILWASNFEMPTHVSGRTLSKLSRPGSDDWVPGEFAGELRFADGLSAGFFCSFKLANQQMVSVSGDEGYLTIDDFVLPLYDSQTHWGIHRHDLQIDQGQWNFRRRSQPFTCDEYHSGEANAQEVEMVRTFAKHVIDQNPDPRLSDRAIQTQLILDACRRSDDQDGVFVSLS